MALPGYIDRMAGRERLKQQLISKHAVRVKGTEEEGTVFEPPGGWDGFWGDDDPILDAKCQMCGKMVQEVRPFGPNHESICEACAAKDPAMTAKRYRGLNPEPGDVPEPGVTDNPVNFNVNANR